MHSYQSKPHMTGESTDTSFHLQMWMWRAEALQSMGTAGTGLPSPPARATPAVQPSWALGTGTHWHSREGQKTTWREQRNEQHRPLLPHHTTSWTAQMPRSLRVLSLSSVGARVCWVQYHQPMFPHQRAPGQEPAHQFQQED